jgi:hypothetical protein
MKEEGMRPMLSIDKKKSANIRMAEVEEHKKTSQMNIPSLCQFENESIEEHLLRPTWLTHKIQFFVKNTIK